MTKVERNQRKEWMLQLFESGLTYQEIGDVAGVSKQRVFQLIGKSDRDSFRYITKERCFFDGLRDYLNENRISIKELTRQMYGQLHGNMYSTLKEQLKNKPGFKLLTMAKINKILSVTGLTYEQAFLSQEDEINATN